VTAQDALILHDATEVRVDERSEATSYVGRVPVEAKPAAPVDGRLGVAASANDESGFGRITLDTFLAGPGLGLEASGVENDGRGEAVAPGIVSQPELAKSKEGAEFVRGIFNFHCDNILLGNFEIVNKKMKEYSIEYQPLA